MIAENAQVDLFAQAPAEGADVVIAAPAVLEDLL